LHRIGAAEDELFAEAVRYHQAGRLAEADILYRRILARDPCQPAILHNLGVIARQTENPAAAAALFRRALSLRPDYPEALGNLGIAWRDQGDHRQAAATLERAVCLQPDVAELHNNLGGVHKEQGRIDGAIREFRRALSIQPDQPEIRCNLAAALLQRGDYGEGWREHEWRLHRDVSWAKPRLFGQPRWTGEDLTGRTILLHAEQGLGDGLQFARYATPIAARGARVILEVAPSLTALLATVPGVAQVVAAGAALPAFDCHLPLMSAPALLGTTVATIPAEIPYITAHAAMVAAWGRRLAHLPGPKVGLAWAGDPRPHDWRAHAVDRQRSMALTRLTPLLDLPGISVVSLQKGVAAAQIGDIAPERRPFDPMDAVVDFADTAALVANLDLVIAVDTAVVHLAGAIGKPAWILSRFDGCWRWLLDREDSPWYPTARLFRQTTPGDWDAVVARLVEALAKHGIPFKEQEA
jgi:tetratricopeptide (TPR) repeat protein